MKKILVALGVASIMGLTACSHKNPMETEPKGKTADFLIQASTYAEIKMNYKMRDHGVIYAACLDNKFEDEPEFCPKFYDFMIEYAHQSASPYDDITLQDLKNQESFKTIEKEYFRVYRKNSEKPR